MEIVSWIRNAATSLGAQQMMLVLVALCLLLVVMMGVSLLILHRRTRRAERQVKTLSEGVS